MKAFLFFLIILFFLYLLIQLVYSGYFFIVGRNLAKTVYTEDVAIGDQSKDPLKVYVGGDSLAAGVGASSFETSMSGRLAKFLSLKSSLNFVNEAVSGLRMAGLLTRPIPAEKQDLIVLIISSNDLFNFVSLDKFEQDSRKVLAKYSPLTKKLILIGPAKIGSAPAIPRFMVPFYNIQEPKYAALLEKLSKDYQNIVYVRPGSIGAGDFASDSFHPNDEGHKKWFEWVKEVL